MKTHFALTADPAIAPLRNIQTARTSIHASACLTTCRAVRRNYECRHEQAKTRTDLDREEKRPKLEPRILLEDPASRTTPSIA
jgi:hypothetical protein